MIQININLTNEEYRQLWRSLDNDSIDNDPKNVKLIKSIANKIGFSI
jgi:hypothetical protein